MKSYIFNLETTKIELHFEKSEYAALSAEQKADLKSAFLWSRAGSCWVSRAKEPNLWRAKQVAAKLGFTEEQREGERLSFSEQVERQAERAERRAERYEQYAENAERRGASLQAPLNRMHGDIAFFTQPIIAGHAGSQAFARYLVAMDIPMIGRTASRALDNYFGGSLDAFEEAAISGFDFTVLPDFGATLSGNIHAWFSVPDNLELWKTLQREFTFDDRKESITMENKNSVTYSPFYGCTIVAITTHRRLTNMDVSKYDLVIVDEDIIYSTVIPSRETVSLLMLKKVRKKLAASAPLAAKIRRILKKVKDSEFFTLDEIDWRREYADIKMAVNIPALCSAAYFCYRAASKQENDLTEDSITFIKPVKFSDNKYIMLSATADETICNLYFNEENVRFYNCKEAANTGNLNQCGDKSMGRSSIRKDPSIIKRIKRWTKFDYTISFKEFHKHYEGDLHFGNCAGCDMLKGQNIDVIGTPHQPEWIYKLFAYSLGYDVDDDLKPGTVVVHNGFRFRFMTYADETLRAIQFYMIESELEQAVGRARLLRCDCTVNLFSDFPLKQAELKESKYDTDENDEDSEST